MGPMLHVAPQVSQVSSFPEVPKGSVQQEDTLGQIIPTSYDPGLNRDLEIAGEYPAPSRRMQAVAGEISVRGGVWEQGSLTSIKV